jgi:hypothetical protein
MLSAKERRMLQKNQVRKEKEDLYKNLNVYTSLLWEKLSRELDNLPSTTTDFVMFWDSSECHLNKELGKDLHFSNLQKEFVFAELTKNLENLGYKVTNYFRPSSSLYQLGISWDKSNVFLKLLCILFC